MGNTSHTLRFSFKKNICLPFLAFFLAWYLFCCNFCLTNTWPFYPLRRLIYGLSVGRPFPCLVYCWLLVLVFFCWLAPQQREERDQSRRWLRMRQSLMAAANFIFNQRPRPKFPQKGNIIIFDATLISLQAENLNINSYMVAKQMDFCFPGSC